MHLDKKVNFISLKYFGPSTCSKAISQKASLSFKKQPRLLDSCVGCFIWSLLCAKHRIKEKAAVKVERSRIGFIKALCKALHELMQMHYKIMCHPKKQKRHKYEWLKTTGRHDRISMLILYKYWSFN